jgi:hypothetical protein
MQNRILNALRNLLIIVLPVGILLSLRPSTLAETKASNSLDLRPFLNYKLPEAISYSTNGWTLRDAFPTVSFQSPTFVSDFQSTNGITFVSEREGRLFALIGNNAGRLDKRLLLDISSRTQGWGDCGFLSFAFHPGFAIGNHTNSYIFVFYQYSPNPRPGPLPPPKDFSSFNRLSRFEIHPTTFVADAESEIVLIDQFDRSPTHNGGSILFGNDGFLYVSLGDEGEDFGDENGQSSGKNFFSGLLRIDVDCDPKRSHAIGAKPSRAGSRSANYFIPNDNPFIGSFTNILEEFYCLGLRSPHRISLDVQTGTIWAGDVGGWTGGYEEVNIIKAGLNYGWPWKEGKGNVHSAAIRQGLQLRDPIVSYDRENGDRCVIGGVVYWGSDAELRGKYIFGDNASGRIWSVTYDDSSETCGEVQELCSLSPEHRGESGLSSFGLDASGEIYLCVLGGNGKTNGRILRLVRRVSLQSDETVPKRLSELGFRTETGRTVPPYGFKPYDINVPFWSDGSHKQRWIGMALRNDLYGSKGETIRFSEKGSWDFPKGTVFVKEFRLPIDERDASLFTTIETRVLVLNGPKSYGFSYRWNDSQSDANLVSERAEEDITIPEKDVAEWALCDFASDSPEGIERKYHFSYRYTDEDFDLRFNAASNSVFQDGLLVTTSLHKDGSSLKLLLDHNTKKVSLEEFGGDGTANQYLAAAHKASLGLNNNVYLRLKRSGDVFRAYTGGDGIRWHLTDERRIYFPRRVYIGAITPVDAKVPPNNRVPEMLKSQRWTYPGSSDCTTCHGYDSGFVLGVNTRQINKHIFISQECTNQLSDWTAEGFFSNLEVPIADIARFEALKPFGDRTASLEDRVWSYLDANCSHCHHGESSYGRFDAKYSTGTTDKLSQSPLYSSLGIEGVHLIVPGDPSRSILVERIKRIGPGAMPPLGRHTIDNDALYFLTMWINSLTNIGEMDQPNTAVGAKDDAIVLGFPMERQVGLSNYPSHDDPSDWIHRGPLKISDNTDDTSDYRDDIRIAKNQHGNRFQLPEEVEMPAVVISEGSISSSHRGLLGEYYAGILEPSSEPLFSRLDKRIDFDWKYSSPSWKLKADGFSVRWTGWLKPARSDYYTIYSKSDDGCRVWIGGALIIDRWRLQSKSESDGTILLEGDRYYPIKVEYFENDVSASIQLQWESLHTPKAVIPSSVLFAARDRTPYSAYIVVLTFGLLVLTLYALKRTVWERVKLYL